jgi:hypothetical protein
LEKGKELAQKIASNAGMTNYALTHVLPRIVDSGQTEGLLLESMMAAIAQSAPEAKQRLKDFLEGRAKKVGRILNRRCTFSYKKFLSLSSYGVQECSFWPTQTIKTYNPDGSILFRLNSELKPFPKTITDRLWEWSLQQPEKTFIAQRNQEGIWQELSYADTYQQMCSIAQHLLIWVLRKMILW